MPKTITTETVVYTFEELSDEAKQKAVEKYYDWNVSYDWWDSVYDDAARVAALMGIDIERIYFRGFSSQGDGACFEGTYGYRKNSLKLVQEYAPKDSELHQIARDLIAVQRPAFYRLYASAEQRGHYMHSGCMSVNVTKDDSYSYTDHATAEQEDGITQALREFADWIYTQLEKEYDYLTSEEAISESLIANECEFTADGSIY